MSQLSRRESILPDGAQQSASESDSPRPTLEPVLQNALESLDINLEEELARYRRHILLQQRAARQNTTPAAALTESPFSFDGLDQGLDDALPPLVLPSGVEELAANVTEANPELDAVQTPEEVGEVAAQGISSSELVPIGPEALETEPVDSEVSFDLATTGAEADLVPSLPPNPDDYLESSEELLRSLENEEKRAEAIANESLDSASKQSLVDSIFTPLGVGSILLLILSSATLGYLVIRPSTLNMVASWLNLDGNNGSPARTQIQPEGGLSNLSPDLAASEFDPIRASNLSSLPGVVEKNTLDPSTQTDGEAEGATGANGDTASGESNSNTVAGAPSALNNNGANPSSPANTGGSAVVPPARVVGPSLSTSLPSAPPRVAPPRPGRVPRAATPTPRPAANPPAPRAITPPAPIRTTPVTATPAPRPPPPTPAADIVPGPIPTPVEEQEGDPSIGVRPTVPTSVPTQTPAPAPAQASPSPAAAPAPAPVSTPAPAPAPAPTATAPTAPPVSSSPVQEDLYYVTTPYTGDQSLESAREAVNGSYVRNFPEGTQVQMGAFSNPDGAESLRQNLQDQGIQAEIYKEE